MTETKTTAGEREFWKFWATREAARLRKLGGAPPPHSDDPVLREWRFCNCYRELDRGTLWFAARRGATLERVLWQSVAYRLLNRRETFEAAEAAAIFWDSPEALDEWLDWLAARSQGGEALFTGRHIVRGLGPYAQSMRWMRANARSVADALAGAGGSLKAECSVLRAVPGVGPFFAWQVARDLVEAGVLPEDNAWALAGPGARRGASLTAPGSGAPLRERGALAEMLRLRDNQDAAASALDLDRSSWYRAPVNLADVEHTLCEFARYETLRSDPAARAKCGRYGS